MKNSILLFVFILALTLVSCDSKEENNHLIPKIDCDEFVSGLLTYDNEKLKTEFIKITIDLEPENTVDDQFGHLENFQVIIDQLNMCDLIFTQLLCYACIKTNPPQTELLITIDSSGHSVKRVIDLLTPSDNIISFIRVHEYH